MQGWISLHRQIFNNEFYFSERFTKVQAWIDLLLLANNKPATFFIRGNEVRLKRGELGYSIKTLSQRWKWNARTVDKFLQMLSKREMIQCRKNNITTVISINNYDYYQRNTSQTTTQTNRRIHTNNNDNKELIELAESLIDSINKETSFYSILNKYISSLGEEKMLIILNGCLNRDNKFPNENRLAAYLETCAKNPALPNKNKNNLITEALPELTGEEPQWL